MNFYNDIDPRVCEWTRELIRAGEIPPGEVVCKSITQITPDELRLFTQCHFFNGISGWAYALKLAGWPADRPVWCASLPCQPFSSAGKQAGMSDERHLWPDFFRLVRECRPECIIGEQVEAAIRLGWLDGVCADLEAEGYAVGQIVLGAHSAGAPGIRQRIFWVAHAHEQQAIAANTEGLHAAEAAGHGNSIEPAGDAGGMGNTDGDGRKQAGCDASGLHEAHGSGEANRVGDEVQDGAWARFDLIPCRDGKSRRVESRAFPLAPSIPHRVGPLLSSLGCLGKSAVKAARANRNIRLRGYGNAINAETAAEFVRAIMEIIPSTPSAPGKAVA